MSTSASKAALRKRIGALLAAMAPQSIASESEAIARRLLSSKFYQGARTISCFLSMPSEFQTGLIIEDAQETKKTLFVPRVNGKKRDDMAQLLVEPDERVDSFPKSPWNIPEPPLVATGGHSRPDWQHASSPPLDIIIVPGAAFTPSGKRLGHGRGYYDTFLEKLFEDYERRGIAKPKLVGVCLPCQIVGEDELPMEPWDKKVDLVMSSGDLVD
jgi:5-formyltetrahydrofolate cyclo-ligase